MTQDQVKDQVSDKPTEGAQNVIADAPADTLAKRIEQLETQYKAELAGLNRRNSELEKALKEKEREKLDETARARAELDDIIKEQELAKKETVALRKSARVLEAGLPAHVAQWISADTDDTICEEISSFKALVDEVATAKYKDEIARKFGSTAAPVASTTEIDTTLQAQYDAAKSSKNFALMTAVQRAASREGVTINT